MKTHGGCAAGILSYTRSPGKDINLSEVQKVASLRNRGHFERSHDSCRAGLADASHEVGLGASKSSREDEETAGLRRDVIFSSAGRTQGPLSAPFTFSSLARLFSLTQILQPSRNTLTPHSMT